MSISLEFSDFMSFFKIKAKSYVVFVIFERLGFKYLILTDFNMEEKCRTCLSFRKNVRSIYEYDADGDYSFVHMITSLCNVNILRDDGITNKICLRCRKRLKEAFEFKLIIERSDAALQTSANRKTIKFGNLEDILLKIVIPKSEGFISKHQLNIQEYFKGGKSSVTYNGAIIRKVVPYDNKLINENRPLSVVDVLNNIKGDSKKDLDVDNYDADYDPMADDENEEYFLPLLERRRRKKSYNKKSSTLKATKKDCKSLRFNFKSKLKPVLKPIKPVFLSDIRVLPKKMDEKKTLKKKKYESRREMCNYCGKICTSIKHHLLIHTGERSFKCDICGRGYLCPRSLQKHKSNHHGERKFKCDQCVAAFSSPVGLKTHQLSHSEERKFVCDICSKGFKRPGALHRHKLMHNVANKTVKCELCKMSFFSKFGLNHHMRVHTGERPYNCQICSQPYSYKHDFNRHCFKKHGVFLKRRSVYVMNEQVLKSERALMKDLLLKIHGIVRDGENINPFEGPQAAQAFAQAVRDLKEKRIPVDFKF